LTCSDLRVALLVLLVSACPLVRATAQDSAAVTEGFTVTEGLPPRKVLATGLTAGILAGSLVESYYSWWKGAHDPFTFHAEGWFRTNRGIDKAGHLFTSYFYFRTFRNLLLWGGYEAETAYWWAAGLSAFFALSVEVGDGLSEYAFDYQDLVFNAAGLGYGMLQTSVPALRNFNLKWSYVPDGGYRFPPRFTEHYDAHTYWLTANVNELLPESLEPYWPDVLQVGVGYSVADRVSRSEWVVGLDFNLEVLRPESQDLRLIIRTLDAFHYPAPAVKFSEKRAPEYRLFQLN
jgi:hypothetical protein